MTELPTLDQQIGTAEAEGDRRRAAALKATQLKQLTATGQAEVRSLELTRPKEPR
jgi:hypothetical protein